MGLLKELFRGKKPDEYSMLREEQLRQAVGQRYAELKAIGARIPKPRPGPKYRDKALKYLRTTHADGKLGRRRIREKQVEERSIRIRRKNQAREPREVKTAGTPGTEPVYRPHFQENTLSRADTKGMTSSQRKKYRKQKKMQDTLLHTGVGSRYRPTGGWGNSFSESSKKRSMDEKRKELKERAIKGGKLSGGIVVKKPRRKRRGRRKH